MVWCCNVVRLAMNIYEVSNSYNYIVHFIIELAPPQSQDHNN